MKKFLKNYSLLISNMSSELKFVYHILLSLFFTISETVLGFIFAFLNILICIDIIKKYER